MVWPTSRRVRHPHAIAGLVILAIATGAAYSLAPAPASTGSVAVPQPDGGAQPAGFAMPGADSKPALPESAASGDWMARAQEHVAEREYWASQTERGLQAPNRAHGLRTYFGGEGIEVLDRTGADPTPLVEMRLASLGRGAEPRAVSAGEISSERERVEIRRPGVVEWYENSREGLEQGFTLGTRPEGAGPLVLELALAHAKASPRGDAAMLVNPTGRRLRYDRLVAQDAAGRTLVARIEVPVPERIRLVVEDAGAEYPVVVDPLLTAQYDAAIVGGQSGAGLGWSVASAGDVNGDGYADVIVGSYGYDSGEMDEGAAFVFHGGAAGIASGNPLSIAHTVLQSNQPSARMGFSVAGAGDVNGDGYADVIVGALNFTNGPETGEGGAFVFLGGASGVADGNPLTAATRLEANQGAARLGFSVAGAGDVNGDGYADVIVGADQYDHPESNEGSAFVFLGGASGVAHGDPTSAAMRIESNQAGAHLGTVGGAGDVNGDGYADVIVGARYYNAPETDEGAAFVFLGSALLVPDVATAGAAAQLESNQAGAYLGSSVASAGDVNGDGYADVIVGASYYADPETAEGAAFVFLGGPAGVADGNPGTASARLKTNQSGAGPVSVAGAGDVNGDGYADVIVGSAGYSADQSGEGMAWVFLGGASGVADGDPGTAAAKLEGNQGSAKFGWAVAGAGDVNGDGYADVIVGANYYDASQTNEGAAFVFLGGASGIASGGPSTAATRLESDQAGADFAYSVAAAGDVNGDGYADVIVGAPQYYAPLASRGAAFVFIGGPSGIADGSPSTAAALLDFDAGGFGHSVASAGDVNGDGYADVIVGAPYYESYRGAAFVFLGGPGGIASGNPVAAARLDSDQAGAWFGSSVASAGDVNGDGYADVIVGAKEYSFGQTDEGAAFVFLGGPSGIASGNQSTAAARLESNQANAAFGGSVASAGDVNGDGYADVIVGARAYDFSGSSANGAAFVFLGSASGVMSGNPSTAAARLKPGPVNYSNLGVSVASAGDVNGDGYADVIVGAYTYETHGPGTETGAAFVFLGSASGIADGNPSTASARLESDRVGAHLGYSVASAGDVNGDGYADVIVGAEEYSSGQTDEGAAFVFLGGPSGIAHGDEVTAAARLESDDAYAYLGTSVAPAGDVNGDGYADVIVGAKDYSSGQADEGAAFVFLGNSSGRPVLSGQQRAGSNARVEPWGASASASAFRAELRASHPQGRGRVRAEIEACPSGVAFGQPGCTTIFSSWVPVGGSTPDVVLAQDLAGLTPGELYRWRARVQHAGATGSIANAPAHGPWRRFGAQSREADIRVLVTPPTTYACGNGVDDDADGLADFPADPGCSGATDTSEHEAVLPCDDWADNDWDGSVDYPGDPGCSGPSDSSELGAAACDDGLDNDGDGRIDSFMDPGCSSPTDSSELGTAACDDGLDNDGDGKIDYGTGVSKDPGCSSPTSTLEDPECNDGIDNDGDGKIDYPADPQCTTASGVLESSGGKTCGLLGIEPFLVLGAARSVVALAGRRRRARPSEAI